MQITRSSPAVVTSSTTDSPSAQSTPAADARDNFLQQQADQIASLFHPTPSAQLRQTEIATEQARQVFRGYMLENYLDLSDSTSFATLIERYVSEHGSLDFSQNASLVEELGLELDQYGSATSESDAAPGLAQALSNYLVYSLAGAINFPSVHNSSLSSEHPEQGRERVINGIKTALQRGTSVLTHRLSETTAQRLATQLAPIVAPDPTLYLTGLPSEMKYGDRQWGDLMVGIKVARDAGLAQETHTPQQLIALGRAALKQEMQSAQQPSTQGLSLAQYKTLSMALAQRQIDFRRDTNQQLAQKLEQFIQHEYRFEIQRARALTHLGEPPSRMDIAKDIINNTPGHRADEWVDSYVGTVSASGQPQNLTKKITKLEAYMAGERFPGNTNLPADLNQRFEREFSQYRDSAQTAVGDLLLAQASMDIPPPSRNGVKHQFEMLAPKLSYQTHATVDTATGPVGMSRDPVRFKPLPLTYLIKVSEKDPWLSSATPRYYLFSATELDKGFQPLPANITEESQLNAWIQQTGNIERLFGASARTAIANETERFTLEAGADSLKTGTLTEATRAAGAHHADYLNRDIKEKAYGATSRERFLEGVKNFALSMVPFYDMIQAIRKGDTSDAIVSGFFDLIGFIPTIGSSVKLGGKVARAGTKAAQAAATAFTRSMIETGIRAATRAAIGAAGKSIAKAAPRIGRSIVNLGLTMIDDVLPFGAPNFRVNTPKGAQLAGLTEQLTDAPELTAALTRAASAPPTPGVVRHAGGYGTAANLADATVVDGIKQLKIKDSAGNEILLAIGESGEFGSTQKVMLKKHQGVNGSVFYTAIDPLTGRSFGARLEMIAIDASGSVEKSLVPIGSSAHLDRIKVSNSDQLERLDRARLHSPSSRIFDDGGDQFIAMDGQWFRYKADRNRPHTGLIYPEGSMGINHRNRVVYDEKFGWRMERGAELRGGAGPRHWSLDSSPESPTATPLSQETLDGTKLSPDDPLADTAKNLRQQVLVSTNNKMPISEKKNIAVATFTIDGQDQSLKLSAASGKRDSPFPGTVSFDKNHIRHYTPDPNANFLDPNRHAYDSEVYIFEEFHRLNPTNGRGPRRDISGTLELFTEYSCCLSCQDVIRQFHADYPNIAISIKYNELYTASAGKLRKPEQFQAAAVAQALRA